MFQPAVLSGRLARAGVPTLYGRLGDWPGVLSVLAVLCLAAVPLARALTARARRG